MTTPRIRVFAGPNGAGKSTLAEWLSKNYSVNLYNYINADAMFSEIGRTLKLACPFPMDNAALQEFASKTTFPDICKSYFSSGKITIKDDFFTFAQEAVNSYTVAMLADFIRGEYMEHGFSFSSETVFSHPSKIELLKEAQRKVFRTYLYFVATEYPDININRIATRVRDGGHDVPYEKVVERFHRCLDNVSHALPYVNRAYFFDNTGTEVRFIGECNDGKWRFCLVDFPKWFMKSVYKNLL
ncbi:MAG: hypothetical protein IJS08_00820 [Victivallales bacterium]|nr:hypothetical protein [Victivallales bacterium]